MTSHFRVMGFRAHIIAKLTALKADVEARAATLQAGQPAKLLTAEEMARGHPKVTSVSDFQGLRYGVRIGGWFGWLWLAFTTVHAGFMLWGLGRGTVTMNGALIAEADGWHYFMMGLIYAPFFLIGFAFSVARYRITLSDAAVTVQWRILPYLGWTWTLPVGADVKVSLAYRGARQNKKPVDSVVVASLDQETHFGAFLAEDVKAFLASAIQDYYGSPAMDVDAREAAPFISPSNA